MKKKRPKQKTDQSAFAFFLISSISCLTSCSNFTSETIVNSLNNSDGVDSSKASSQDSFKIANVSINPGQVSAQVADIFIANDASGSPLGISEFCEVNISGSSTKVCQARFSWKEVNSKSGSTVIIDREVTTNLSQVQSFLISAPAPSVFDAEIVDGTFIKIEIIPLSGQSFTVESFNFQKGVTGNQNSDFKDSKGNSLVNIFHYSCFDTTKRAFQVTGRKDTFNGNSQIGSAPVSIIRSTQFCIPGVTDNIQGCDDLGGPSESAQSYYYDLFVPSNVLGKFNLTNQKYTCPAVKESLSGDVGAPDAYPLDSTIALASNVSPDFPVPVEAPSVLGNSGDPNSGNTTCDVNGDGQSASPGDPNAISTRCIGFAKLPSTDGTCPSFTDENGKIRQTFRLRRFLTVYPILFEANGDVKDQAQPLNIYYSIDRPVDSGNPEAPYSMLGPKPCPFAFLDHSGATGEALAGSAGAYNTVNGGKPTYRAINSDKWNVNVDGTHFPNQDDFSKRSCSATLPIIQYASSGGPESVGLATTHPSNTSTTDGSTPNQVSLGGGRSISLDKVHIRPFQPHKIHYIEDKDFQACAPLSDQFQDPPLHFSKTSSGDVAWCAEVYPTQNNAVGEIDRKVGATSSDPFFHPGFVVNYTSHGKKQTKGSAGNPCQASLPDIPTSWPSVLDPGAKCVSPQDTDIIGAAHHPQGLFIDYASPGVPICANHSCDRTITNVGSDSVFRVPLLAPPSDVEKLLRSDTSYRCAITHDNGSGKMGRSPSDGC